MDKLVTGYLKSYATAEDKEHDISYSNYQRIQHVSEQLAMWAKSATHAPHVGLEEMDRMLQIGEVLKKELDHVRSELARRKNLELLLPSPNTQHHLPCSSLLSPTSPTPSSPTSQQSMAISTSASSNSGSLVSQSSNGSTSPHGLNSLNADSSSMSITSTGVMQSDEYWRRKIDPTKIVRRPPTPLYVHLTEQMILAQSSKRKRPAEGDLYCHNCKTKDTPEWRRGPMGAKTLCNACGIRWRLSQAEAGRQKKGELSPTQTPQLQFPIPSHQIPSPSMSPPSPTQSPTTQQPQLSAQQSLMQQQQQLRHQNMLHHQQQQQMQQLQQQYAQSHANHHPPHPQQQHMIVTGPVGLAQENIPNSRLALPGDTGARSASSVMSSLSSTPSPIAT